MIDSDLVVQDLPVSSEQYWRLRSEVCPWSEVGDDLPCFLYNKRYQLCQPTA